MITKQAPPINFKWQAASIKNLRKHLKLSQTALSRELGIRQQTISEWENGMYQPRGASVTILTLLAVSSNFPFEIEKNEDKKKPLLNKRYRPIRSSDNSPVQRNFTSTNTNRLTEEATRAANNLNTPAINIVKYSDIDKNIYPANNTEVPM
jgi:DNA-binding XRE family transcriptional regulator